MKKIVVLFSLLVFTFSYGQKKVKKSQNIPVVEKKASITEEEIVKKITTKPLQKDYDSDITLDPTYRPIYNVVDENFDQLYNSAGIEIRPEFPGGKEAMNDFILSKYIFPKSKENVNSIEGKVIATFVVEKDGSLTDIKIIRDIGNDSGKQILEILKNMPKWIPGKQNGKIVRCSTGIPITINATKH